MDADGIASTEYPLPSEPIIIISNSNSSSCPQSDLPPPSSTSYLNGNEHHESSCNGDANFIQKEDFEIKYEKEEEEEEGEDENAFPEHSNSGEQQQQQLLQSLTESDDTTIETAAINNVLKAETGEPDSIQSSENNIIGHDDEDDDYRINFAPTFRPVRRRLNPPPTLPLPPLMSALKRPKQEEKDPISPSSSSPSSSFEPSFDANLIVPTKRAHIAVTAATVPGWLLNRHLSRLDIFSKESGAALAKRRAQRKSLLQLQTAQQAEKGKSNSGQLPAAPVTKGDHRLPAMVPGPSNGAATVAPYICRRCAHRFTSKETLKLHMSLHREMKWEDDDDDSENTALTTNCTTAATITTNGNELNDIAEEKVKSEPGAIITNGLPSPSDYIYDDDGYDYDDDDDDYDDDDNEDELLDERDPEVDEMGQVKLKPFTCYINDDDDDDSEEDEEEEEYEEEEDGVYGNHSTTNGGYQSGDDYEDRQNFEQQQQPKVPPLPPPPTRPSAKRQKALQKKTSRYMSKKLEKLAALPQVLTGNQLPPTIDGKFVTVSLACPACKLSLPDKDQLDAHLLSVHQLHPFRCLLPGCEASFGTR